MLAAAFNHLHGGRIRIDIDHAAHHIARIQLLDHLAGAVHGLHGRSHRHALLEASGGLGADTEGAGCQTGLGIVKDRALEHHRMGLFGDLGLLAAHDTCHAGGLGSVADHQLAGAQRMRLTVQCRDMLAFPRLAHNDVVSLDHFQVEGVHGMAGFEHDEIGDIHHIVDRAHAGAVEVLPEPQGAWPNTHILNHARYIAGAQLRVLHVHLHIVVDISAALLDRDLGLSEACAAGHGGLPGNAPHGQAVRAVGEHLKIHDRLVQSQNRLDIAAHGIILMEDQNAFAPHRGIELRRHTDLIARADHALGGHTAQLALLDLNSARQMGAHQCHRHQLARSHVRRAAYDLQRSFLAHIHRAHMQVIRVRMGIAGEHAAHHNLADLRAELLIALHAVSDHDHIALEGLGIHITGRIVPDPFHRYFHRTSSFPFSGFSGGTGRGSGHRPHRADACPRFRSAAWRCAPDRCRRRSRSTHWSQSRTFPAPWD